MELNIECRICNEIVTVSVTEEEYVKWMKGALVQKAFPNLTPAQREMFITGYCDRCFKKACEIS